jgi:hypothetical protein
MPRLQPEAPATRRVQHEFLDDLLGHRTRGLAEREGAFRRPPRGAIDDRWHIYSHGYTARVAEALEQEFAAIRRILGLGAFTALVERYLAVFSPRSFDLGCVGDRLARFLDFDSLSLELPFLPDLARLEQTISECFTAADARILSWAELQAKSADDVAALRMCLAPGVRLLRSPWPLKDLWASRLEPNDEAISIGVANRPSAVLVSRRDGRVFVEEVSEAEATLLEAAGTGDVTLPDLHGLTGTPETAAAVARLIGTFRGLIARGVFVLRRGAGLTGALEFSKEGVS